MSPSRTKKSDVFGQAGEGLQILGRIQPDQLFCPILLNRLVAQIIELIRPECRNKLGAFSRKRTEKLARGRGRVRAYSHSHLGRKSHRPYLARRDCITTSVGFPNLRQNFTEHPRLSLQRSSKQDIETTLRAISDIAKGNTDV